MIERRKEVFTLKAHGYSMRDIARRLDITQSAASRNFQWACSAWGEHLDIARVIELIGEYDLARGIALMGASMHMLKRDLIVISLAEEEALISPPISPTKITEPPEAMQILG